MERFSAVAFYDIAATLQQVHFAEASQDQKIRAGSPAIGFLGRLEKQCEAINLTMSVKAVQRLIRAFSDGEHRAKEFQEAIPELHRRIADEMEEKLFLYIPPERAGLYDQAELLGKEVNAKFPTVQFDSVEAGNCYATGRSTAAVFHLMRIMETAVQAFGNKLGVPLTGEKVWQVILYGINAKIKSLPPKDPETVKMAQASANLYAVKLAWRNEVMHPKETYTLEEADNLIRQVSIFMQQLATVV